MNLAKLFETQKILRDRIGYNEPDRFDKLILALLVEIGECANEVRCFKFWSHKPASEKKVILEEYVDGLHFILELGLEKGFESVDYPYLHELNFDNYTERDTNKQFIRIYSAVNEFTVYESLDVYEELFLYFIGLSKHFDCTWEEIEEAYFTKNKINHERQESGY